MLVYQRVWWQSWWQSWWHCCKLFYQSTRDVDWCMAAASKKVLSARTDPSCRCHRYPMVSMGSCTSVTETPEQWRGFDQRGESRVDQGLSDLSIPMPEEWLKSSIINLPSTYHQPIIIFIPSLKKKNIHHQFKLIPIFHPIIYLPSKNIYYPLIIPIFPNCSIHISIIIYPIYQ